MHEESFVPHHFTLSVRSISRSARFYNFFGFTSVLRWEDKNGSLAIEHFLHPGGLILEMFEYCTNNETPMPVNSVGNNLEHIGVKHIAFKVPDLKHTRKRLLDAKIGKITEAQAGRTGIDYFFISDPDGNWVEIVQDERPLTSRDARAS